MSDIVRKHIKFYGSVQGVGFRYRARQAAGLLGVTGWVRNEFDGSVTMEIQGTEEQIEKVIAMINQGRYVRMDAIVPRSIPVIEDEKVFGLKR